MPNGRRCLSSMQSQLLRAVFGEGLCTFLFLFIVEAVAVNNGRQEQPENLTLAAVSTAFCSIALIYSFADVSGAHFNPAVTFATMVTGKVSLRKGNVVWDGWRFVEFVTKFSFYSDRAGVHGHPTVCLYLGHRGPPHRFPGTSCRLHFYPRIHCRRH